jgi:hypothetical protein
MSMVKHLQVAMLMTAILGASTLHAQATSAKPSACAANASQPRFDFQVEQPARLVQTSADGPVPDSTLHQRQPFTADFALVQFVVDTAGKPVSATLKMLTTPASLEKETVAASLEHWYYEPAIIKGCAVAQLVQTPLRWK